MKINKVLTQTIVGIYSSPSDSNHLFLKGGSAMRLFDNLTSRLSIDADFSVADSIKSDKKFFNAIKSSVGAEFRKLKYDIIDFKWERRPNKRRPGIPDCWGGWACEFKLVSFKHRGKDALTKRRNAFIPEGANSPKITIDISEHEYCDNNRTISIQGVTVIAYSQELLVLEKLRAICQQHPDYEYGSTRNRARDFYDIYGLTVNADNDFTSRCSGLINKVFEAKKVPLELLNSLWDETFIDEQRRGFDEVRDTVSGQVYDFDIYLEHVRFLVKEMHIFRSSERPLSIHPPPAPPIKGGE